MPYHSRVGWDLLLKVGRALRPKHVIVMGDLADCYSISAHDKDPARAGRMKEELDAVNGCLDQLDALGAKDKLFIEGNHEDRIRRYVQKAPELANVLSMEKELRLEQRKWEFVRYKDHAKRGHAHFTHDVGSAGRNAIYSALGLYQKTIVTAHTHRMQYVVEGSATGDSTLAASFGWLGDVEYVDYMNKAQARRNWCLGFGYGYLDRVTGIAYLVPVPIVRGSCMVNGTLYTSKLKPSRRRAA